jgi:hypothetical protein
MFMLKINLKNIILIYFQVKNTLKNNSYNNITSLKMANYRHKMKEFVCFCILKVF